MMDQINITDLRQHLPSYLKQVQAGKALQITSHGKVIARIVPEDDPVTEARRKLQAAQGESWIGDVESPIDVEWSADADNL